MSLTLDQKIAQAEARLARLKEQVRKSDTRQKIVVGGAIIHAAMGDLGQARTLLALLEREVTREADQAVIKSLLVRLREVSEQTAGTESEAGA